MLTYGELQAKVNACASGLVARGVAPRDRVAMLTTPRLEWAIVFLALARIGAVWVGLDPRYRLPELRHPILQTGAAFLFALTGFEDRDYREDIVALATECPSLRSVVTVGERVEEFLTFDDFVSAADVSVLGSCRSRHLYPQSGVPRRSVDPRCIVFTSGSTGQPKGAVLSDQGLVANAREMALRCISPEFRLLTDFPVNHVGGATMLYMSAIVGGTLYPRERFEPNSLVELLVEADITCWYPMLAQFELCRDYLREHHLPKLATLGLGGVPTTERLQEMLTVCPDIVAAFGMTETSDVVLVTEPGIPLDKLEHQNVGRPVRGVAIRLRQPDGAEVPLGQEGEIQVRGECVMLEYFGQPEATEAAFTGDGWFKTGDLARETEDGSLQYIGRGDDTFKSGGYNIYPREVELAFEAHSAVLRAAVVGVPHAVWGAVGHAYVELEPGAEATSASLESFVREHLANYKVPKQIEVLPSLPLTRTHKIDKTALRARSASTARPSRVDDSRQ